VVKKHYGFLYIAISWVIDNLQFLNLVEFFKFLARKFNEAPSDKIQVAYYNRIGTDTFITVKWIYLIILWHYQISNKFAISVTWYLLITNVFTYFYYHIWAKDAISANVIPIDQVRRRFLNLVFAAIFSTLCFSFLFSVPYRAEFAWKAGQVDKLHAILFSFSNSLAANYEDVKPVTNFGNIIANLQLLVSFIFFTVILGRSIPQTTSKT
jgi:hypothetical protein